MPIPTAGGDPCGWLGKEGLVLKTTSRLQQANHPVWHWSGPPYFQPRSPTQRSAQAPFARCHKPHQAEQQHN
jgi:hypothetical protein